jgi:arylsulfatase B
VAEKTIANRLRDSGYATGLVGKWHLGGTAEFHPQRRGFDEFFGFLHEGHYYVPSPWQGVTTWLRKKTLPDGGKGRWSSPDGRIVWSTQMEHNEHEYDTDNPLLRSSQPVDEKANLTDVFTREACDFIGRHQSQPFFLYLAYNAVHSPMQGADQYMKKFAHIEDIQRRIFAAMLAHLDDSIGKVLARLRETGNEENTLVVFLSDNGGPTKELTSRNAPLRSGKGELLEGGIRVPFIVSWKNHIPAGKELDTPVTSMDATATAGDLARAASEKTTLDGVSLFPLLTEQVTKLRERPLFWRVGKQNAMRLGDWKLERNGKEWQLYDLAHDIGEATDLAPQEPARVQQMSALWDKWNAEQSEPRWR